MTGKTPRSIAMEIYGSNPLSEYTEKQKIHISYNLAVEIVEGELTFEGIPNRLKTMDIPDFKCEVADIKETDVKSLPINQQIEYYHKKGMPPREIMDKVNKTYTRVKNIIKKLKDQV